MQMSFRQIAQQHRNATESSNQNLVNETEEQAIESLNGFLSGAYDIDSDDSPFYYSFIREMSRTDNVDLKILARKAEVKLLPLLKQFDSEMGYDFTNEVPSEFLERNLNDLDEYEKIDAFSFENMNKISRLLGKIQLTDDDGKTLNNNNLKQDLLSTAQLKTYLRLCLNMNKITLETYATALQLELESLLITLLLMDKSSATDDKDILHAEFEKFLDAIDEDYDKQ